LEAVTPGPPRLKRGDIATVALPGSFGKPRPALVVQSDLFNETHPTVTILPLTSDLRNAPLFRIVVEPSATNGLQKVSQIMVDKPMTFPREKIGTAFGRLDDETMLRVNRALAVWVGIA
jgi:mRNA interferase MazF